MSRSLVSLGLGPEAEATPPRPDEAEDGPISTPAGGRRSPPGGMALSATLHVVAIALVLQLALARVPRVEPNLSVRPRADAVFLPPPAVLRRILALPPAPAPHRSTPLSKDRISIGPPAPMRSPEPLQLHRDDDLTAVAKGRPEASQAPRPVQAAPPPPPTRVAGASLGEGGRLTPTIVPQGVPGPILASLQRLASGAGDPGPLGVPTGAGGQMGPLFFDPQGADFTAWIQRFKNEVYRNWIVPPSASLGWSGQVDFEFVVDRHGTITEVTLLESSGTAAYDRAARNALVDSRLLPLPDDFAPATVTMKVGFVYNTPRGGARSGR